jgi:hypothetical protein
MTHFLHRLTVAAVPARNASPRFGLWLPWLTVVLASVAVPWVLFRAAGIGAIADALSPATLWSASWPVLIGIGLGIGLTRGQRFLPRVPEGDVVVLEEWAARASLAWGAPLERVEALFRHWIVASLSLLAVALMLGLALFGSVMVR